MTLVNRWPWIAATQEAESTELQVTNVCLLWEKPGWEQGKQGDTGSESGAAGEGPPPHLLGPRPWGLSPHQQERSGGCCLLNHRVLTAKLGAREASRPGETCADKLTRHAQVQEACHPREAPGVRGTVRQGHGQEAGPDWLVRAMRAGSGAQGCLVRVTWPRVTSRRSSQLVSHEGGWAGLSLPALPLACDKCPGGSRLLSLGIGCPGRGRQGPVWKPQNTESGRQG